MYLIWASPILVVIFAIVGLRMRPLVAGLVGTVFALAVAITTAPRVLGLPELLRAAGEGVWLTWLVGIVIVAGMFFRAVVDALSSRTPPSGEARRHVFTACFLIGPFVEAGTGVGVGQVASVAMLLPLGLPKPTVVVLALFSQMLVPWGAMANGTMIGAVLSGLTPQELGYYTALVSIPLLAAWLALFWHVCAKAGMPTNFAQGLEEAVWMSLAAGFLVVANVYVGPEIAAMAALAPLIGARYLLQHGFVWRTASKAALLVLPYAVLILGISMTRLVPGIALSLGDLSVNPLSAPLPWHPFTHPATWLAGVATMFALFCGRPKVILTAMRFAWTGTWLSVATLAVYFFIASLMSASYTIGALSSGLRDSLGPAAVVASPVLAALLAFLVGSLAATNALLMGAQPALAASAGLPLTWVAAVHNAAAGAASMLSPVRVAFACGLVGGKGLEHEAYRRGWVVGVTPVVILSCFLASWYALR